jgi:hypothetical protein
VSAGSSAPNANASVGNRERTGCCTPSSPSKELTTAFALGAAFLAAKPTVEAIREAKMTAVFMVAEGALSNRDEKWMSMALQQRPFVPSHLVEVSSTYVESRISQLNES